MHIGEVIRTHRKMKNMTQEEMANRLGITAPAVNKWEKQNSLPDITLLAPIARLLDITLDTLLSFHEDLTSEEINSIITEANSRLKEEPYEDAFQWAKKKVECYPNCEQLIWQIALVFDVWCMTSGIPNAEAYEPYIRDWYGRALESKDEELRSGAADSLFNFYFRKEQYGEAEKYLEYFSKQNPERKRKLAQIYANTNRQDEAYKTYEELLFTGCNMMTMVLQSIYMLSLKENDMEKAHMMVKKQQELGKVFEMGEYYEASYGLELAVMEKDVDATINIMEKMLTRIWTLDEFSKSKLYEHMTFSELKADFLEQLKKNLIDNFRDEETYGFLKEDKRWQDLVR